MRVMEKCATPFTDTVEGQKIQMGMGGVDGKWNGNGRSFKKEGFDAIMGPLIGNEGAPHGTLSSAGPFKTVFSFFALEKQQLRCQNPATTVQPTKLCWVSFVL